MREFLNAGLKVTANTDNRTVSNTTLTKELEFIQKNYGITDEEIHLMMRNAVDVAFADDAVKKDVEVCIKTGKMFKSIRKKTDFNQKSSHLRIRSRRLCREDPDRKDRKIYRHRRLSGIDRSGHKGQFVFGYVKDVPVVLMQGRVHYYEGYSMQDVVLPTRLMGMMGAKKILLTNAAGGVNPSFRPGDFMLITDHITTAVPSPLIGPNIEELGTRFPDMSEVYSKNLQKNHP